MAEWRRRRTAAEENSGAWPLRRWLTIAVGVLVVVFTGSIIAGTLAISGLVDAGTGWSRTADPAASQALRLSRSLIDQETGLRGYALTAQDDFLGPYRTGRANQDGQFAQLRGLVRNDRGAGRHRCPDRRPGAQPGRATTPNR